MSAPGVEQDTKREAQLEGPSRATGIRHLALGFALLVTILFTFALCSLPR
jgi:hypothetical protein